MTIRNRRQNYGRGGFSLIELLAVITVILIVVAFAVPMVVNTVSILRLRGAAAEVASLVQRERMQAVHDNTFYTLEPSELTTSADPSTVWVDLDPAGGNQAVDNGEPRLVLPSGVTVANTGYPTLDAGTLGFTPQAAGTPVRFNARGLPCVQTGSICQNFSLDDSRPVGFTYVLQKDKPLGGTWYAALSVTPAGRVRVWLWDGSNWH